MRRAFALLAALCLTAQASGPMAAVQTARPSSAPLPRAPYVATPQDVVDRMLALAALGPDDVMYDLGTGDGRILITAAQRFGVRGVGIDIDPARVAEATANARLAGVSDRVRFETADALTVNVADADVVTMYLLSSINVRLRPLPTGQLRAGARIVSHNFGMGDWEATTVDTFVDARGATRTLYVWVTDGRTRP